ncbi:glycosyltransferase family 2 protein [Streptomyces sp. NEAU-W12]|uniref:glycosyltransferase family 2 protein n=1 Tax=Streptomyces sp. NEAU-W12 TaxID=2994668 RepID=UPI00224AAB0B|nr:glycosyltransferase family 2 protein [Streptomyces sp. NEAU-W12]MCX2926052.1 glycosyltransferase family 2 protein [Streptomyces sp. NEAU-W12]
MVGGDISLLPYSLAHYRDMGVESFHVIRHVESRDDPSLLPSTVVMRNAGIDFVDICVSPWHEDLNAALIRKEMSAHPDDWWIVADLDEFHVYDRPVADVVAYCEQHGFDFVEGAFLDRVSAEGCLTGPALPGHTPLWRQYPLAGLLTFHLLGGRPTKVTLARGSVELDLGQHYAWTGRGVPVREIYAQVHHFKWTASARRRLVRRVGAYSSGEWRLLHRSIVEESQAFLGHLEENGGRINVDEPSFRFSRCSLDYADHPRWNEVGAMLSSRFRAYDAARQEKRRSALRPAADGAGEAAGT